MSHGRGVQAHHRHRPQLQRAEQGDLLHRSDDDEHRCTAHDPEAHTRAPGHGGAHRPVRTDPSRDQTSALRSGVLHRRGGHRSAEAHGNDGLPAPQDSRQHGEARGTYPQGPGGRRDGPDGPVGRREGGEPMPYICPRCGSTCINKEGRVIRCSQCRTKIVELNEPEVRKVAAPRCRR